MKDNTVGNKSAGDSSREAVLRTADGTVQRLGFLPGGSSSHALDLSDDDWVVGQSDLNTGAHAFLWTPQDGLRDLGGGQISSAHAINNRHQIVGYSADGVRTRALLWDPIAGVIDLGDLPGGAGQAYAQQLSETGHVVGHAYLTNPDEPRPFIWTSDQGMRELGALPGGTRRGFAFDVNDNGHVVGLTEGQSPRRAFFWTEESGALDIGFLANFQFNVGTSINNHDWIVGTSRNPGPTSAGRAFLWTPELGITNLNELLDESARGWVIWEAEEIDDRGRIFARGADPSGVSYMMLLTPIPEPEGLVLLGMSLLWLFRRATRLRA